MIHAAAVYSRLHNRVLDVPVKFVVPRPTSLNSEEFFPWPEYLWGLPLGLRLKDIRLKQRYLGGPNRDVRIEQLEGLGFVWSPKRGRKKNV